MFIQKPPYYTTNKEWSYFDPRVFKTKLTDKATPKAINDFIDFTCKIEATPLSLSDEEYAEYEQRIRERTMQEINKYKENKVRYTLKIDSFGEQVLTHIDGKPVSPFQSVEN